MKKFSKLLLTTLLTASLALNSLPIASADDSAASPDTTQSSPDQSDTQPVELLAENISFQYVSTIYNGKEQKPVITVSSGDKALAQNTDFTVTYPEDCINAGKKTVTINGIGGYSGSFSATYLIEPLDCSENNASVKINTESCFYSGMPLTPEVTVTANGITFGSGDYILAFYDNVNVTTDDEKAKCEITFRGNFTGSRTEEFEIYRAQPKDLGIQIPVRPGSRVVYDLAPLKPSGASFGTIEYLSWEYTKNNLPKIAFNELSFTVSDDFDGSTAITIPVINSDNYEDYSIVIYPTETDKPVPTLTAVSPDCVYNGEPFTSEVFNTNGSYAEVDGKIISGTWDFDNPPPQLPCSKVPCVVTFTPDDQQYSPVDTVVFITINRNKVPEFTIKPNRSEISIWQLGQLVVSGIPEDYKGTFTLSLSDDKPEIKEIFCEDLTQREYEVEFSLKSGKYTFTAELSGDGIYLPASSQCSIIVGDYVPPEDKPADKVTTAEELAALIASAAEGSTVKAEGMRTVPANLVRAAYDKRLILEVKLNNSYTWIVDTAKLSAPNEFDLDISTAVIPAVLLNKIGGENHCSFNASAKNLGSGAKLRISAEYKTGTFANLFLYTTAGDLKFVSCAPIKADGSAELNIGASGKFAVMIGSETKLPGDINNDCKINVIDVLQIIELILDEYPDYNRDIKKFDLNNDETLNVTDVMLLIDLILKAD